MNAPSRTELRIGPDRIESEPIGTLERAGFTDGLYESTFRLDFRGFDWISGIACYLPDPAPELSPDQQAQLAEARVAAFIPTLDANFPGWLHRGILWDQYVRSLDAAQFLRWLESQTADLPRILGIPAVQERLISIRRGTARQRRDAADSLARSLAGVTTGRTKAPDARWLYHEVNAARTYLQPVYEILQRANTQPMTAASAWRQLEHDHKSTAEELTRFNLDGKWFDWGSCRGGRAAAEARRSVRRKDVSPLSLACEFIAARYRLSAETVEQRYQAVNAGRKPRRVGGKSPRAKRIR